MKRIINISTGEPPGLYRLRVIRKILSLSTTAGRTLDNRQLTINYALSIERKNILL